MNIKELLTTCRLVRVTPQLLSSCNEFSCGDDDLDEFFSKDFDVFGRKLACKTYAFQSLTNDKQLVALFSLSNDSIRITNLKQEDWDQIEYVTEGGEKNLKRWPGVLIGRLGTNVNLRGHGYGTAIMDFIKAWFRSEENKTGCRFIIVEALNQDRTLNYYEKNGFLYLYSTEENEAKAMGLNIKKPGTFPLHTRLMFFDLLKT
ncbi:MAG: GNAT family N-acetyltransferase, partial [Bacteroidales bacterium]|nr:GNAT family N-acetyltransferase [Candidatus Physcocola equi]